MSTRNRLANARNDFQGSAKRVLTVCSGGLLRSPTAAWVLSNAPWNFNTRSCGYNAEYALVVLDQVLLAWADEVVVMDSVQKSEVEYLLSKWDMSKPVHNVNVEDDYDFRDPELVSVLTERFTELFPVDTAVE